MHLAGLSPALAGTPVDVWFGEPSAEFRPLPVAPERNPDHRPAPLARLTTPGAPAGGGPHGAGGAIGGAVVSAPEGPVHEVLEYLWTLVAGAYKQDPTSGEIVGQMIVAMIPVVGQIADMRDLSAYTYQLSRPGLAAELRRGAWIGLVLTGVALLLPEVGAAVAGVGRLALKGGPEVERLVLPLLRRVGRGNALRFVERELSAARVTAYATQAFDRVAGHLRQFFDAVEHTWLPVGDAVRQAARQGLADLARVAGEARSAIRQVAAEIEAKVKPLLAKIESEGERASGRTNGAVEHQAPAGAAGRGPEPEGPGEGGRIAHAFEHTRPTGEAGGKPTGTRTKIGPKQDASVRRALQRENEAAETMADRGYRVDQNPPTLANGRNPDYIVEGHAFDCYSPSADTTPRSISTSLAKKIENGQARRFVVNLDDWTGDLAALRRQLETWPLRDLQEVIGVRDGSVVHIFP